MKKIRVLVEYAALELNDGFDYLCESDSISPGCRVWVDFNGRKLVGFVESVQEARDETGLKSVLEVIDEKPLLNQELMDLARKTAWTCVSSLISVYKAMLPPALKPNSGKPDVVMEEWFEPGLPSFALSRKAQAFLDENRQYLPMKASVFRALSKTLWKSMLANGDIVSVLKPKRFAMLENLTPTSAPALNLEQVQAIESIRSSSQQVSLLHGVTGSGKTEVFFALAKEQLDLGRQVLFLVPEIGLTPMMIERICSRFDVPAAIYHSRLSDAEKYDQYMKVKNNEARIVIGTRSAVFMPFENLGLILVDEEHDPSYKQMNTPRYQAKTIASERAAYHHCKVVLASATPSLESFSRAWKGIYNLVQMKKRVHENQPAIHMIDCRNEQLIDGFSRPLLDAIAQRLAKKEQVILLLNRRGYYPIRRCLDCKTVIECEECQVPMSYHKKGNMMVCHICGSSKHFNNICPSCGSSHFSSTGYGTERLEERLACLFPQAHIVRMDADTTSGKQAHGKLLKEFEEQGDILIGTQMVAKGLDFKRVTLVGILQADNALIRQDYRASESAYELFEQACGRSGRSEQGGEVYIQTFDQDHFVMRAIKNHSYRDFYRQEMNYRHLGQYPPYVYMCSLVFSSLDYQTALKSASWFKKKLQGVKTLGPADITMRQRQHRIRLIVKDKNEDHLVCEIWSVYEEYKKEKGRARLDINMHPVMLEE